MAPNDEVSGLRTALAMGAAKAILVSDEALAGSDALGTAKVLAKAIERVEGADLILTATESSDGYTGTVPEQIAGLLDLPSVTFAKQIEIDGTTVKVQRQTDAGFDEVECPLPAVVSVTAGVVEPRYPSFKGIMAAKSKPVDTLKVADLGLDASAVGWAGAGQEIVAIEEAPAREAGEVIEDDGAGLREDRRLPRQPQGHLGGTGTWLSRRSGCCAEATDGKVTTTTLELLTKARELAGTVEAVYAGGDADAVAGQLGEYGATKVLTTGDLGGALPGVPVAGAIAAAVEGGNAPDAILFGHQLRRP